MDSDSDSSSKSDPDSDSENVDKVEEENVSMDTNEGHSTVVDVWNTIWNTITQNNTNIDDTHIETGNITNNKKTSDSFSSSKRSEKKWDDVDFSMFIEDGSLSGISDVIEDYENKKKCRTSGMVV